MFNFVDLFKEVHRGKSIYRIMLNWHIKQYCNNMRGMVVDLASGDASYNRYMKKDKMKMIRADYDASVIPDIVVDLNKPLPFNDKEVDYVLFFNAIYIVDDPERTLKECARILKNKGILYLSSPFVFNESREPHDYYRFTSEKLNALFTDAGFGEIKIIPMGERFTAASFLTGRFLPLRTLRFCLYLGAIICDRLIPTKMRMTYPCPMGYFCIVKT